MDLTKLSIQEYLSLGYIYLIFIGMISDVVYFKFLGINILSYSTILDVILTPINIVTDSKKGLFALIILLILAYYLVKFPYRFHLKYREKNWYKKLYRNNIEKMDKSYAVLNGKAQGVTMYALFVAAFFFGTGLGKGPKLRSKIEKGEIELSHIIKFSDNELTRVKIVGQNSSYLFYLLENEKKISVSPIAQNIKEIREIAKVDKEE